MAPPSTFSGSGSGKNRRGRSSAAGWLTEGGAFLLAAFTLALALVAAGSFVWVVGHRVAYPYDLEWMEGSMLHHALRVASGQPIYAAPSIDFIPHLYTPLYPMLVAALGKLCGGVGYLPARSVSVLSFAGALAIGVYWARREGGSLAAGLAAMALPVAAFADTGGFYDLVRCDSLQLLLTVAGAALAWYGRGSHRLMALAALTLVAGFFAKQTAAPFIVAVGGALLLTRRPAVLTFAGVGIASFALIAYALNRSSGGWFWTYIFQLHQSHAFFTRRAWVETPAMLLRLTGAGLLLVPWALLSQGLGRSPGQRQRGPGLLFLGWLGLTGLFAACLAFGTQWAHTNALIPGLFFPAIAMGAAAGRLLHRAAPQPAAGATPTSGRPRLQTSAQRHGRALRHGLVWLLLGLSLLPRVYTLRPQAHIPTAADRQAGDAVVERLRTAPGDVLIPFHPFYAHLAGKPVFLHRMGVWDVRGTAAGPVHGLSAAFVQRRFSRIIFDDKVEATWGDWPEVLQNYRIVERIAGPRVVEGARTMPALVLEPMVAIDRELQ